MRTFNFSLTIIIWIIWKGMFSQASVYKPFCENPSWTVVSTNFGISNYTTFQYEKDTTINSSIYKKIKHTNSSTYVLFREDIVQKKVYQYDLANSIDYLYIDFSLNYGDQFNLTVGGSVYTLTVCTKDSVLINGDYHNKINLSDNGGFSSYFNFVEGILSEINPLNPFYWPGDSQKWTICECHNGQFYYNFDAAQINNFSCELTCTTPSITTNINELPNDKQFNNYPNPTSKYIHIIDKQNILQYSTIEIKNSIGKIMYSSPFTTDIDISYLSQGIYFLTIEGFFGKQTSKIIKE